MEIYALVGASGTGKSHRAMLVANQLGAQAIIDDGLLIYGNQIMAGSSAKRQPNIIDAIKSAIFMDENRAEEMRDAIAKVSPNKILILGTSERMIERITTRLNLPPVQKIVYIEDYATEKEIMDAKNLRTKYHKHVIPAPALEVKKSFPSTLVDPFHILLKKKETTTTKKNIWMEQSVVRPTFTLNGKLIITDHAIRDIANHGALLIKGVTSAGRISVNVEESGDIAIDISPTITYGLATHKVAIDIQRQVETIVEDMTGLRVKKVNVLVKNLSFQKPKETK